MTQFVEPPPGYAVGQRIRTNARYAACNKRNPGPRFGVIVSGSKGRDGPVMIKLDEHRHPHPMTTNLFEVIDGAVE
jgi:hypothetical protein